MSACLFCGPWGGIYGSPDLAAVGEKGEELRGSLRLFLWNFRHLVGCKRVLRGCRRWKNSNRRVCVVKDDAGGEFERERVCKN